MSRVAAPVLLALALGTFARGQGAARDRDAERMPDGSAGVPRGLPESLGETLRADPPALRELGARLFAEPRLSRDGSLACVDCHRPGHGHADDVARSVGVGGARTERNAPSLFNRALGASFFWDGRAATLEEQVLQPIESENEMNLPLTEALALLAADADYAERFQLATGRAPDAAGLASALAAHVRSLVLGDSPVDRFRLGDRAALNELERTGLWVYESRGRCWRCHDGANFTDEAFHNTGIGSRGADVLPGRAAVTGDPADRGAFKTPSLRGVALSPPYMHDGSLADLEAVVAFYRGGGGPNENLDPRIEPLELTDHEAEALVAFLRALSREAEGPLRSEAE